MAGRRSWFWDWNTRFCGLWSGTKWELELPSIEVVEDSHFQKQIQIEVSSNQFEVVFKFGPLRIRCSLVSCFIIWLVVIYREPFLKQTIESSFLPFLHFLSNLFHFWYIEYLVLPALSSKMARHLHRKLQGLNTLYFKIRQFLNRFPGCRTITQLNDSFRRWLQFLD